MNESFDRNKGIGASEAPVVVGLSPWKTPLQLWRDKRGLSDKGRATIAQRAGLALESIVIEELEEKIGRQVTQRQVQFFDTTHNWRWATVDGIAGDHLVEAKTSSSKDGWGEEGTDQIPPYYAVQVQHALACVGLEVAYVPVLFGTRDFCVYEIARDEAIIKAITTAEAEFMRRIAQNDPPPISDASDLKIRWTKDNGATIVATEEVALTCLALTKRKADLKKEEAFIEELESTVKLAMADAAALVDADGKVLATWKASKDSTRFDMEAFKLAHPDLWFQFQKHASGSRRFLLK